MGFRKRLLSQAMRVPPPLGPWLIGLLIGRRPIYRGQERASDPRADIIERCRHLTPKQHVAFMPIALQEAFGRTDAGVVMELRRELDDEYGQQFDIRQNGAGVLMVSRKRGPALG